MGSMRHIPELRVGVVVDQPEQAGRGRVDATLVRLINCDADDFVVMTEVVYASGLASDGKGVTSFHNALARADEIRLGLGLLQRWKVTLTTRNPDGQAELCDSLTLDAVDANDAVVKLLRDHKHLFTGLTSVTIEELP